MLIVGTKSTSKTNKENKGDIRQKEKPGEMSKLKLERAYMRQKIMF